MEVLGVVLNSQPRDQHTVFQVYFIMALGYGGLNVLILGCVYQGTGTVFQVAWKVQYEVCSVVLAHDC